jgi:F-type H+-transporting ATPase subunit c
MDAISLIGAMSIISAALCIAIGGIGPAIGEANVAANALRSMAQQPDESSTITRTLFVSMAMIESTAIYAFVITILILYANPFWNYVVEQAATK